MKGNRMNELIMALIPLLCQVESGNKALAVGDGGLAIGILQIHSRYWKDGCYYLAVDYPYKMAYNPVKAKEVVKGYLMRYGVAYQKTTGKPVTMEVLARIHNGGPKGYTKAATLPYWEKVKALLPKGTE
jgi:hypothetical protein